jgi:hypothetical protein
VDRAARWYRDNAGLSERRRWVDQTFGSATLVSMQRGPGGVTLDGTSVELPPAPAQASHHIPSGNP